MSSIVELSLELAKQSVRFFPVIPNSKLPAVDHFAERATSDPEKLLHLFEPNKNSGIACGRIKNDLYLVGFDIDHKTGKPGYETLAKMEASGETLPPTWAQRTPSGGEHRLFWSPVPIRQGTDVCGPGIDLRGDGGYLVGPGSIIDGVQYEPLNHLTIARFPDWAIAKYQKTAKVIEMRPSTDARINPVAALVRAVEYLQGLPEVREGNRNQEGYRAVCKVKDLGAEKEQILDLMRTYWKCTPQLEDDELIQIINSAFKYGENEPGSAAPETVFDKIEVPKEDKPRHPVDILNDNHFFMATAAGSRVGWETTDENGDFRLNFIPLPAFHDMHAAWKIVRDEKPVAVTKMWLQSPQRRTYDRLVFDPSGRVSEKQYNLWKGFAVEPAKSLKTVSPKAKRGLDMFLEHCLENVCRGDVELNKWLIGFFAHIFQKPDERPRVCLVFKGEKGTGKNAVAECIGHLLASAFVVISDHKRVFTRFNSVLESKLLVVLDEAFFSGDKSVDGILKSLITEETRIFERKNLESRVEKVYDRIIIIGNEERLVNATGDERRYAVFDVGRGRAKDWEFFKEMKESIREHGGAEALLRYLLDYDLSEIALDEAPATAALNEQKQHSIGIFETWWHQCLQDGVVHGAVERGWPEKLLTTELKSAFVRWVDSEKVRGYIPAGSVVGKVFARIAAGSSERTSIRHDGHVMKAYRILPLDLARLDWDRYIGFQSDWEDE